MGRLGRTTAATAHRDWLGSGLLGAGGESHKPKASRGKSSSRPSEGGRSRMRKRSIMWAGLVGLLAVIVVGTSVAATGKLGRTSKAGVLRMSIGAEPPSLDPGLATDTTSANILFNLMDPLIRLGDPPALKAEPGAATSWIGQGCRSSRSTCAARQVDERAARRPPATTSTRGCGRSRLSWARTTRTSSSGSRAPRRTTAAIRQGELQRAAGRRSGSRRRHVQAADHADLAAAVVHPAAVAHLVPARATRPPSTKYGKKWTEAGEHRHATGRSSSLVEARRVAARWSRTPAGVARSRSS